MKPLEILNYHYSHVYKDNKMEDPSHDLLLPQEFQMTLRVVNLKHDFFQCFVFLDLYDIDH